jgi:hypothetical protein
MLVGESSIVSSIRASDSMTAVEVVVNGGTAGTHHTFIPPENYVDCTFTQFKGYLDGAICEFWKPRRSRTLKDKVVR